MKILSYEAYLFDLDGTLLDLDFRKFVGAYYELLARKIGHLIPRETFLAALEHGLRAVFANDGSRTNQEVFFEAFEEMCGPSDERFMKALEEFYEHDFGQLGTHGKPFKDIRDVLYELKNRGKKIALATNPVFPRRAVEHRIEWAGLGGFPFDIITTYETMHATKPSPRYFHEVLEKINTSAERALMVGDDPDLDLPAAAAGIDVVLIRNGDAGNVALEAHPETEARIVSMARSEFVRAVLRELGYKRC